MKWTDVDEASGKHEECDTERWGAKSPAQRAVNEVSNAASVGENKATIRTGPGDEEAVKAEEERI